MRFWRNWWQTLIFSIQQNPPQFIEYLMVSFATVLAMRRFYTPDWPYVVLSASLAVSAAVSMWVRVLILPMHHRNLFKVLSAALLFYSLCTFADLVLYF